MFSYLLIFFFPTFRHYVDVHGYDATIADAPDADDEMPDGALCTECGEIFINRHGLMRHLIKAHSKPGGEQCLYCPFRYKKFFCCKIFLSTF